MGDAAVNNTNEPAQTIPSGGGVGVYGLPLGGCGELYTAGGEQRAAVQRGMTQKALWRSDQESSSDVAQAPRLICR